MFSRKAFSTSAFSEQAFLFSDEGGGIGNPSNGLPGVLFLTIARRRKRR